MAAKKKLDIGFEPKMDVQNGLLVLYERETRYLKDYGFADIVRGQRLYDRPKDKRKAKAFYFKITP